jgi:hypothetical protein
LPSKLPRFHTVSSRPVKAPLCAPSYELWLSWQPEMRIARALKRLAIFVSRVLTVSVASTSSGSALSSPPASALATSICNLS